MKRLGYSILIGAGCALLFFGISKLPENKRKNKGGLSGIFKKSSSEQESYYSAELQVAIGNPGDNSTLFERTKEQILSRLNVVYRSVHRKIR